MTGPPLVFLSERRDDVFIVTPQCNIGSLIDEPLERELEALNDRLGDSSIKHVIVDFRDCPFIGSSMLGAIIKIWKLVRDRGGLAICNASDVERDILHVGNLDSVWPVCDTLDEALAAVRQPAS